MWKFFQSDKNGIPISICNGLRDEPTLISESVKTVDTHWKSSAITTATTTTVVSVKPNESILLTDILIVLSKKVAGATVIVQFSDGTNTEVLFTLDATVDSFQFSHAFQGGLRGWKEANIQVITNQVTTISVLVVYIHVSTKSTQKYTVWNAGR